jgi:hypothetical protein
MTPKSLFATLNREWLRATIQRSRPGVAPGEVVVLSGVDKLQDGSKVNVHFEGKGGAQRIRRRRDESISSVHSTAGGYCPCVMIGIVLAGAIAYKQLPVSALPQVDLPNHSGDYVFTRARARM